MALAGNHQLYKLAVVDYRVHLRDHPASLEVAGYIRYAIKNRYVRRLPTLFSERRFTYSDAGFLPFLRRYWSRRDLGTCEMLIETEFGTWSSIVRVSPKPAHSTFRPSPAEEPFQGHDFRFGSSLPSLSSAFRLLIRVWLFALESQAHHQR
jgi:hypothetical protein